VQVRDVMTEATITEMPTDKLRSAAERMWREQTGSLLITADGRLTGIITERDVLRAVGLGADPDRATVDEAMTIDVYTVPPDMPLHVAAREMAARWMRPGQAMPWGGCQPGRASGGAGVRRGGRQAGSSNGSGRPSSACAQASSG
jgi:CBS domain-containing protein